MFVLVSPSFWGGPWPPMGKTQAPFPGAATTTFQGQATNPLPWIVVALVGLVLAARLFPAAAAQQAGPAVFQVLESFLPQNYAWYEARILDLCSRVMVQYWGAASLDTIQRGNPSVN